MENINITPEQLKNLMIKYDLIKKFSQEQVNDTFLKESILSKIITKELDQGEQ